MHTQILQDELVLGDLVHLDLGQIEEGLGLMLTVQQVIAAIVVYFKIAHINLIGEGIPLRDLVENVGDRPGYDTTVRIALSPTRDRESLTRARLAICKDGPIVALEATFNHVFCNGVEYSLLLGEHVEHPIKDEVVDVVLHIHVARFLSIFLEYELHLLSLIVQN